MKKLLTLVKNPNIKVKSTITEFLAPETIWIPIEESAHILLTKKNIQKSDPLFEINEKKSFSPISGEIINIVKRKNIFGKEESYLQIKNDFQEKDSYTGMDATTTMVSNTLMQNILNYKEYDWDKLKYQQIIYVNGLEDEPYLANKIFLHKNYTDEILLMSDTIADIFHIEKIKLYIAENDRESIEAFQKVLSTYPKIELNILPDLYPLGNEIVFKKYLKLSEEEKILSTTQLLEFYQEIVKSRRKDFLIITLTGDAIENPQVVKVKNGTSLKEVIEHLLKFNTKEYEIYVNGIMNGIKSEIDWIILTEEIRGIYFMKKINHLEKNCINCGKCNEVCPMDCHPYKSMITKGIYKSEKCIHCGLCTFICPSYITLEKYLQGD